MDLNRKKFDIEIAGKTLTLEVSDLAKQTNAAVMGRYGDTVVLATAVMARNDRDVDYLPLMVDYEEKFYAAGKIIGSRFIRREGRPSDEAILSGRLVDRTVRPLFDQRIRRDIQVVVTVLSFDEENDPDFVALAAASLALGISDIPWAGPVAGVKAGGFGQNIEINPPISKTSAENGADFEAFFSGPEGKINMIELGGNDVDEAVIESALKTAQEEINKLIAWQKKIIEEIGRPKARLLLAEVDADLKNEVNKYLAGKLDDAVYRPSKTERQDKLQELKENLIDAVAGDADKKTVEAVGSLFEKAVDEMVHKNIIEKEKRPDGRKPDEIRPLFAEARLFERTHGSALFVRGDTQALSIATLAAPGAEQLIETMETTGKRRFMHHYNFPRYSVGEVGSFRGPGRREIGHGALAGKALRKIIPSQEEFPYTIRLVSETLSSNGSSSMASVCAGSLSLMDAGVPVKKAVAGIAMGLMFESDDNYKILTDIQGPEDHHGDMDLKVAGTADGVTAIQMDVKINGLDVKIIKAALEQGKKARLKILELMNKVLDKPRSQISPYAPVVLMLRIDPEKIGEVIGPGGKIINGIIASTGGQTTIDIEDDGRIFVGGPTKETANAALESIKSIVKNYEVGEIVHGKVVKILDFGAIVEFGHGKDGMIHVSELKEGYVKKVEDVVKTGDEVWAKVIRVEPEGKIALSLKGVPQNKRL